MIVADTNLIGYLYLESRHSPQAEKALRKDAHWAAPLLWRGEFRNVLALYIRKQWLSLEESRPIIEYLNRHATKPEFVYRHQWRAHDILLWDNRCTMHQALGDFDETQLRDLERTTVLGTPSGYVVPNG